MHIHGQGTHHCKHFRQESEIEEDLVHKIKAKW